MAVNFGAILDRPSSEIKPPPTLPPGSYLCQVVGLPRYDKSSQKGTEFAEYTLSVLAPGDDVDEGELAEFDDGVKGKLIKATYYLTENSTFRLKQFLEHCGCKIDPKQGLRPYLEQVNGAQVVAFMKVDPNRDPTDTTRRTRLSATAPVEG